MNIKPHILYWKWNDDLLDKNIVQYDPAYSNPRVRKIDIQVNKDCHMVVNGNSRIKILSSLGLGIDYDDLIIESLVIEEADVSGTKDRKGYSGW